MFFKFQEGFSFDSEHEVWISVGWFFEFLKTIGFNFLNSIKIKESPILVLKILLKSKNMPVPFLYKFRPP